MAQYEYKARNNEAKLVTGIIDAYDTQDAIIKLSEQGLFTIDIEEKAKEKSSFVMKSKQLSEFSKQLSVMLSSGLPIVKALFIIANGETENKKVQKVYLSLYRAIKSGLSLSAAMREQGKAFPELIINMFYSGEVSGTIAGVAEKMADYYQADYKLRKKISQALMYPKILIALTLAALIIIFTFVLPSILSMLEDQSLPAITQFMANVSYIVVYRWYYVIIAAVSLILIFLYLRTVKSIRYHIDKLKVKIYKIGSLMKIIYTARFARTLSSLYGSGIQLVTAVTVSSKIIGNSYIQEQFPEAVKKIKQGESLSKVISETDGFSKRLENIIIIGEETGKLDDILSFCASNFEYEAEAAINSLLSVIEPLMLIIMAVLIGSVIISVLLPIFQMYDVIGGM